MEASTGRHLAFVRVSFKALQHMLALPDSSRIVAIATPDRVAGVVQGSVELLVEDARFAEVSYYQMVPVYEAKYETEYIARPQFKEYV